VEVPPLTGVAVKVNAVPEQIEVSLATILTLGVTTGLTVIVIEFEVTVGVLTQAELEVISQVTTSLFDHKALLNMDVLVPTATPFTFH
jgi:hypothetical protein